MLAMIRRFAATALAVLLTASPALAADHQAFVPSTGGAAQATVALLLASLFGMLIVEACHKTLAAAAVVAALLLISAATPLKLLDFRSAVESVDWNVIFLLGSMMTIVAVLIETRLFDWLNLQVVRRARGRSRLLMNVVIGTTAVLSAFADNVTTVLFMAPVAAKAARSLRISVWALAMPMIMASNIGGTATLIGDPPNVIIGIAGGLSFMDFIRFLAVPILFMVLALSAFSALWFRHELAAAGNEPSDELDTVEIAEPKVLAWALGMIALTFLGFFTHDLTELPVGVIAFTGASATMLGRHAILRRSIGAKTADHRFTHCFERGIEWLTLGFFIFLFMAIGAAERTGLITRAAGGLQDLVQTVSLTLGLGAQATLLMAALLILVFSAVVSAVVDNIPYTIAAVAIVRVLVAGFSGDLTAAGLPAEQVVIDTNVLWWALALGACLGGNGTLIGASANVTTVGLLEKDGHHMPFLEFLRFGLPVMAITVAIAALYLGAYVYVGAIRTNEIGGALLALLVIAAVPRSRIPSGGGGGKAVASPVERPLE